MAEETVRFLVTPPKPPEKGDVVRFVVSPPKAAEAGDPVRFTVVPPKPPGPGDAVRFTVTPPRPMQIPGTEKTGLPGVPTTVGARMPGGPSISGLLGTHAVKELGGASLTDVYDLAVQTAGETAQRALGQSAGQIRAAMPAPTAAAEFLASALRAVPKLADFLVFTPMGAATLGTMGVAPALLKPAVGAAFGTMQTLQEITPEMKVRAGSSLDRAIKDPSPENLGDLAGNIGIIAAPFAHPAISGVRNIPYRIDRALAEHNVEAIRAVETERVGGLIKDLAEQRLPEYMEPSQATTILPERVPVTYLNKPAMLQPMGVSGKGRPGYEIVDVESGKVVFSGSGAAVQDVLRTRASVPESIPAVVAEAQPVFGVVGRKPPAEMKTPEGFVQEAPPPVLREPWTPSKANIEPLPPGAPRAPWTPPTPAPRWTPGAVPMAEPETRPMPSAEMRLPNVKNGLAVIPGSISGEIRNVVIGRNGPTTAYRTVGNVDELRTAYATGLWSSLKKETAEFEGRTQFGLDPKQLAVWGIDPEKGPALLVEADLGGLRAKVPRDQYDPNWKMVVGDIGTGIGVEDPIPVSRIRHIWEINPETGKIVREVDPLSFGGLPSAESRIPEDYGAWFSPKGEEFPLSSREAHGTLAAELTGIPPGRPLGTKPAGVVLLDKGWIRLRGVFVEASSDALQTEGFQVAVERAASAARMRGDKAVMVEILPSGRPHGDFSSVPLEDLGELLASPLAYIRQRGPSAESRVLEAYRERQAATGLAVVPLDPIGTVPEADLLDIAVRARPVSLAIQNAWADLSSILGVNLGPVPALSVGLGGQESVGGQPVVDVTYTVNPSTPNYYGNVSYAARTAWGSLTDFVHARLEAAGTDLSQEDLLRLENTFARHRQALMEAFDSAELQSSLLSRLHEVAVNQMGLSGVAKQWAMTMDVPTAQQFIARVREEPTVFFQTVLPRGGIVKEVPRFDQVFVEHANLAGMSDLASRIQADPLVAEWLDALGGVTRDIVSVGTKAGVFTPEVAKQMEKVKEITLAFSTDPFLEGRFQFLDSRMEIPSVALTTIVPFTDMPPALQAGHALGVLVHEIAHAGGVHGVGDAFDRTLKALRVALQAEPGFIPKVKDALKEIYARRTPEGNGIVRILGDFREEFNRLPREPIVRVSAPAQAGAPGQAAEARRAGGAVAGSTAGPPGALARPPRGGAPSGALAHVPGGEVRPGLGGAEAGESDTAWPNAESRSILGPGDPQPRGVPAPRPAPNDPAVLAADVVGDVIRPTLGAERTEEIVRNAVHFNWFMANFEHLLQWHWANPGFEPLTRYMKLMEKWETISTMIQHRFSQTLNDWTRLGPARANGVGEMLFQATEMSSWDLKRPLTLKEEMDLARKIGRIDKEMWDMYHRALGDLKFLLAELEESAIEEAKLVYGAAVAPLRVAEIQKDFDSLRNRTYFPMARHGKFMAIAQTSARVKITEHGMTYAKGRAVEQTSWDTEAEAKADMERLKELYKKYPTVVAKTRQSSDVNMAFSGFPPSVFNLIVGRLSQPDPTDKAAVNRHLKDIEMLKDLMFARAPGRGYAKHLRRRRSVRGFSRDAQRGFAKVGQAGSHHIARLRIYREVDGVFQDMAELAGTQRGPEGELIIAPGNQIPMDRLSNAMKAHYNYVMNPGNEFAAIRGGTFTLFFAYVPARILINLLQVPQYTGPLLAERFGDFPAAREIGKAYKDILLSLADPSVLSDVERRLMTRATNDRVLDESFATQMAGYAENDVLKRMLPNTPAEYYWKRLVEWGVKFWQGSEQLNRRVSFLPAIRLALQDNATEDGAYHYAVDVVHQTQFPYSKLYKPAFMRGRTAPLFIFKSYLQNMVNFMFTGKDGRFSPKSRGGWRFWFGFLLTSGFKGLPFMRELLILLSMLITGSKEQLGLKEPHVDLEREFREKMASLKVNPDLLVDGFASQSFGLSYIGHLLGIPIPNISLSGSTAFGQIPAVYPLLQGLRGDIDGKEATLRILTDLIGAGGSIGTNYLASLFEGDKGGSFLGKVPIVGPAVEGLLGQSSPIKAVSNTMKAWQMLDSRQIMSKGGRPLMEVDPNNPGHVAEAVAQGLGFIPSRLAQRREQDAAITSQARYYLGRRGILIEAYAMSQDRDRLAKLKVSSAATADARNAFWEFNRRAPSVFKMNNGQLAEAVNERLANWAASRANRGRSKTEQMRQEGFPEAYGVPSKKPEPLKFP